MGTLQVGQTQWLSMELQFHLLLLRLPSKLGVLQEASFKLVTCTPNMALLAWQMMAITRVHAQH